jgi:hypothetical protein
MIVIATHDDSSDPGASELGECIADYPLSVAGRRKVFEYGPGQQYAINELALRDINDLGDHLLLFIKS